MYTGMAIFNKVIINYQPYAFWFILLYHLLRCASFGMVTTSAHDVNYCRRVTIPQLPL